MDLEFHQLDRRYERLRASSRQRDQEVVASIARNGQQMPIVVVAGGDDGGLIVVDGFKRIRALIQLRHDLVRALCWQMSESEALLLSRLIRGSRGESALEEGWLLRELVDRFDLSAEELARRFGRSPSWVSTRLGLVRELPDAIQEQVRKGEIVPHAAMRYLLPLARADREGAVALAAAIGRLRPTTRQTEALAIAFARGNAKARAFLLEHPELVLRAREGASIADLPGDIPSAQLRKDLGGISGIARRAQGRISEGVLTSLTPPEVEELTRAFARAKSDAHHLFENLELEITNARRRDTNHDLEASPRGTRKTRDRPGAGDITPERPQGDRERDRESSGARASRESGGAP